MTAYRRVMRSITRIEAETLVVLRKEKKDTSIIQLDAKHFKVRKEKYTLYVAYDAMHTTPICWMLLKGSEKREGYDQILQFLKSKRVNIQAIVSDWHHTIRASVSDIYPKAIHQRCAFHVLQCAFRKLNGRRLIQTEYGKKIWEMFRKTTLHFDQEWKAKSYLTRMRKQYPQHEKAWKVISDALPDIYQFTKNTPLSIPRTSNKIENFMGVIEQRFKSFRSMKNPHDLISLLSAFIKSKSK